MQVYTRSFLLRVHEILVVPSSNTSESSSFRREYVPIRLFVYSTHLCPSSSSIYSLKFSWYGIIFPHLREKSSPSNAGNTFCKDSNKIAHTLNHRWMLFCQSTEDTRSSCFLKSFRTWHWTPTQCAGATQPKSFRNPWTKKWHVLNSDNWVIPWEHNQLFFSCELRHDGQNTKSVTLFCSVIHYLLQAVNSTKHAYSSLRFFSKRKIAGAGKEPRYF